ncbi:hypothetical protein [Halostella salina]|uniref:hypothetical protein n=1 Tax=Halostella salina TaxID=1547897 RepID=UPI000EF7C5BB|nr:hypothetical protein [Halostella salina]
MAIDRRSLWALLLTTTIAGGVGFWALSFYSDPYTKTVVGILLAVILARLVFPTFRDYRFDDAAVGRGVRTFPVALLVALIVTQSFVPADAIAAAKALLAAVAVAAGTSYLVAAYDVRAALARRI